jgi:two-component system response regulator YesN
MPGFSFITSTGDSPSRHNGGVAMKYLNGSGRKRMNIGVSRYFTKLLAISILLGAIPVITLGLLSYVISSNSIKEKVIRGNDLILAQIHLRTEKELSLVDKMMNQLMYSTLVTQTLNKAVTQHDFQAVGQIQQEISFMQSYELGISDVVLVNLQKNWLISSGGRFSSFTYYSDPALFSRYTEVGQQFNRYYLSEKSVTVVERLPLHSANPIALLLVDISLDDLNAILAKNKEFGEMFIMDENRKFVAGTSSDEHLHGALESIVAQTAYLENDKAVTTQLNGKPSVIIPYRSSYNNWLYLSVISLDDISMDSREIGRYTIYICTGILILTFLVSLYSSRVIYSPIKRWYGVLRDLVSGSDKGSEIDIISGKLKSLLHLRQQMSDQLKQFFVTKLILGEWRRNEIEEMMRSYNYPTNLKQYVVLVSEFDTLEGTSYTEHDRYLLMFAISNIASEIVPTQERFESIVINQSQVLIMGSEGDDSQEARLLAFERAMDIQKKVRQFLRLPLSIGVSRVHTDLKEIPKAYLEGLEALKYRIRYEQESLLFFDEVQPNRELPPIFPMQMENELIDSIKLGNEEELRQKLSVFLQEIYKNAADHRDYQIFVARLLTDLLRLHQEIGGVMPYDGTVSLFERLFEIKTIPEIESWFMQMLIAPLVKLISEQKDKAHHRISKEVCTMINNEAETNLTLEACAERLNYHPVYVSRVFRQEMGINFGDYLAKVRLGIAKRWLRETDMTISEIAQKLHFSNSGNFIRSFKSSESITPGKYRDQTKH